MPARTLTSLLLCLFAAVAVGAEPPFPLQAKTLLFLGDSITNAGHDVALVETQLRLAGVSPLPEIINLGLPSETASGLSEPTHPFPRPGVHERLDRALAKIHPDIVVACYGMNDGIYAPFSEANFQAYQAGIEKLIDKAHAIGAKVVLMTPPPFDPVPLRKSGKLQSANAGKFDWTGVYENYDEEVLAPYANWILQQKKADMVIDLRAPVLAALREHRRADPEFTFAADGVHLDHAGHEVLANAILQAWNVSAVEHPDPQLLKLVEQRQALLKQAWLSEVGHQRPGMAAGLPMDEAQKQAAVLNQQIAQRLKQLQK